MLAKRLIVAIGRGHESSGPIGFLKDGNGRYRFARESSVGNG
jgi:hypothetical protein